MKVFLWLTKLCKSKNRDFILYICEWE